MEQKTPQTQIESMPRSKKNHTRTIVLVVLLAILVGALMYGVYTWQHNKVRSLQTSVNSLTQEVSDLKKQNQTLKERETEEDTSNVSQPMVSEEALIIAAVRSACEARISTCTSITVVRKTDKFAETTFRSSNENSDGTLPPRSMLLEKTADQAWQVTFVSASPKLCLEGTDHPGMVEYCKGQS